MHNSGTIKVEYLKIMLDLYYIYLKVISKYQWNRMSET